MFFRVCRYVQIVFIHSCGMDAEHLKKFGNALSKGKKETYSNYNYNTWMIVSSPEVRWAYKEACGLPEEAIIATGISRTDRFFDREFHKRAKEKNQEIYFI